MKYAVLSLLLLSTTIHARSYYISSGTGAAATAVDSVARNVANTALQPDDIADKLSATSKDPVQSKVIVVELAKKLPKTDIATATQADSGAEGKLIDAKQLKRKLGEIKNIIPVATVAGMTKKDQWYELTVDDLPAEKGVYWVDQNGNATAQLTDTNLTGEMLAPFSDTYANLPQVPAGTGRYNTILLQDDVGNGTTQAPQYPEGIYLSANQQWYFSGKSLNTAISSITDTQAEDKTSTVMGVSSPKQWDLQRQKGKGTKEKVEEGTETIGRSWDAKTLNEVLSVAGTKVDNTTTTIDAKTEADKLPEDVVKMIAPMLGSKDITYSGTGQMAIFANGVQTNIDNTMTHTMPQGAIGYLFRHGAFYELVYNTQVDQSTPVIVRDVVDAGEEFVAFGMKFRMPTSGIRSPDVMSANGSSHTARGRVVCTDSGGVHAGSSVVAVTTTWKRLCDRNFQQIGDRVEWVFEMDGVFYHYEFIVGGSYNNNPTFIERK